MEHSFKEHRFLNKIDESINKGNSLFYLYGLGINDYALFDLNLGIKEFDKSLFLYFYNVQKVDAFAVIRGGKVQFFDKDGQKISVSKALAVQKKSGGFGANKNEVSKSDAKSNKKTSTQAQEVTDGIGSFAQDLEALQKAIDTKKIAIYFDEFEWQSKLYGEKDLDVLKRVRNWNKSKKSFTIVNIKEPELLKEFGFEVDEELSNMIYLGNPSQNEIAKSYRRYIYTNHPNIEIDEEDFEYIVSAIQGSKKSLRDAMRVLKKVLAYCDKYSLALLKKELFDSSIHKKITEKITFKDVILDTKTKKKILKKVDTFRNDKENSSKGIILYGPSGTGKTYIAKAIAHEHSMNFMAPALADLKGEYIGQTSGKVKRLFEEARANAPTIIFLDEIDTIFPKRGGANTDSYLVDMVNQFLVEIDGATTGKQDIFLIGATNRLEVIDSAIRSRLSSEFLIALPNSINRELIFDSKFSQFRLSQQSWKQEFLAKTEGMSGRDIDNFAKSIKSTHVDENDITQELFYSALKSLEESFVDDFKRDMNNSIEIDLNAKLKFDDVIGYESIKHALNQELDYILSSQVDKEKMETLKIVPKRGNLLYGPPGNGKTTFAKALAGEKNFYYIKILSKDFTTFSSVDTLRKIELIFENTIKLSKMTDRKGIVLFFDEVDTLISANMDASVRGTLLSFLEDTNGIKAKDSNIILIAATNYKEYLDEASIRDGRFDTKLEVGYPSRDEAIEMIKRFFTVDETLDLSEIDDDFYEKLYDCIEQKHIDEVELSNKKIADERFHKRFEGVPTVALQALKEQIKRDSFLNDSKADIIKILNKETKCD